MQRGSSRRDVKMAERVKLEELVLDFTIYPRQMVNNTNVKRLKDAVLAGRRFPPIVADRASKRVVDGFHRYHVAEDLGWADIEVEWRDYKTENDLRLDSMRLNSEHGRSLSPFEIAKCLAIGQKHRIKAERLAEALGLTMARLQEIQLSREAKVMQPNGQEQTLVLKHTLSPFVGKEFTPFQAEHLVEANTKAGGMRAIYYVNQVVNLIEADLIDSADEALAERLRHLARLLEKRLAVAA
jgi:hypothetical protein